MKWEIKYYNNVVEETILNMPSGLLARYLRLVDLIIEFGPNLGLPHTKALKNGLYELRLKSKEGIARVFFCIVIKNEVYVLHSYIKKSQKIPRKELNIAIKRLKEVKKNDTR